MPIEEVWHCTRQSGLAEKYVRIVQDMGSTLRGESGEGGAAPMIGFEPLFVSCIAVVVDRMTDEIREDAPWTMMFADDIVIGSERKEQLEEKLESWRYALERRGMKVNRRKTEYMCVCE